MNQDKYSPDLLLSNRAEASVNFQLKNWVSYVCARKDDDDHLSYTPGPYACDKRTRAAGQLFTARFGRRFRNPYGICSRRETWILTDFWWYKKITKLD